MSRAARSVSIGAATLLLSLARCSSSELSRDSAHAGAAAGARAEGGGAGSAGSSAGRAGSSGNVTTAGSGGGFEVTGSATLAEVAAVFAARCIACHDGSSPSLVDLRDDAGLHQRLTAPLVTASCNGRTLVVPGSLSESLLPAKVQPRPPCGVRMPSECSLQTCLGRAEIQTFVNYVGSGAPPR